MKCLHTQLERRGHGECTICLQDQLLELQLRASLYAVLARKYIHCYLDQTNPIRGREEAISDLATTMEKP